MLEPIFTQIKIEYTVTRPGSAKPKIAIDITTYFIISICRFVNSTEAKHPLNNPAVALVNLDLFCNAIPMNDPTISVRVNGKVGDILFYNGRRITIDIFNDDRFLLFRIILYKLVWLDEPKCTVVVANNFNEVLGCAVL